MKDVRTVFVDQNSILVVVVVSIAANMLSAIANQNLFIRACCESLCKYTAGKAGTYNEVIKHLAYPLNIQMLEGNTPLVTPCG